MQYSVRASSQVHSVHPSFNSAQYIHWVNSVGDVHNKHGLGGCPSLSFTHSSGVSARLGALQPLRGVKKAGNSSVP